MLHVRDILVATDFSECSQRALQLAVAIASRTGARLHLVFVQVLHPDPFSPAAYPADHRDRVFDSLRDAFDNAVREAALPATRVPDATFDVLHDAGVTPAVARYAKSSDIDLLMVGTHGRRGLRHMMLGSVAEELVRTAECPVIAVRADAEMPPSAAGSSREILVPVDFSAHSVEALHAAREMAALFGTGVRVLHVVEETVHPAFYNAGAFSIYDLQPNVEERAWEHLGRLLVETPGPAVRVELEVVDGHASTEILRVAEERKAWLVVMTTHGLTGLAHLFMGSVAERVVRGSPCPVFVLKSFGRSLFDLPAATEHASAN